jgi:hypothetical protein
MVQGGTQFKRYYGGSGEVQEMVLTMMPLCGASAVQVTVAAYSGYHRIIHARFSTVFEHLHLSNDAKEPGW